MLMESSKEFGTAYMDKLRLVVPTGTGSAVLPTVRGMQPVAPTIDAATTTRNRCFDLVMVGPRFEVRKQPRPAVFAGLYV